jgi:hypothetical protein
LRSGTSPTPGKSIYFLSLINTILKQHGYHMVLHRLIESIGIIGNWPTTGLQALWRIAGKLARAIA